MMKKIKIYIRNKLARFLNIENNTQYVKRLKSRGLKVGCNFNIQKEVILDDSHCWLIEIGDNVTLAPRVHVLCHDASTKNHLGYTIIGRVKIGNNVFVGANTIIMPSVSIGDNVIIGANSLVTKDLKEDSVFFGSPAKFVCSIEEYLFQQKERMENSPFFDDTFTLRGGINEAGKDEMRNKIDHSTTKKGYVV